MSLADPLPLPRRTGGLLHQPAGERLSASRLSSSSAATRSSSQPRAPSPSMLSTPAARALARGMGIGAGSSLAQPAAASSLSAASTSASRLSARRRDESGVSVAAARSSSASRPPSSSSSLYSKRAPSPAPAAAPSSVISSATPSLASLRANRGLVSLTRGENSAATPSMIRPSAAAGGSAPRAVLAALSGYGSSGSGPVRAFAPGYAPAAVPASSIHSSTATPLYARPPSSTSAGAAPLAAAGRRSSFSREASPAPSALSSSRDRQPPSPSPASVSSPLEPHSCRSSFSLAQSRSPEQTMSPARLPSPYAPRAATFSSGGEANGPYSTSFGSDAQQHSSFHGRRASLSSSSSNLQSAYSRAMSAAADEQLDLHRYMPPPASSSSFPSQGSTVPARAVVAPSLPLSSSSSSSTVASHRVASISGHFASSHPNHAGSMLASAAAAAASPIVTRPPSAGVGGIAQRRTVSTRSPGSESVSSTASSASSTSSTASSSASSTPSAASSASSFTPPPRRRAGVVSRRRHEEEEEEEEVRSMDASFDEYELQPAGARSRARNSLTTHHVPAPAPPPASTRPSRLRALIGLQNLGNTCFMNSALQCLASTPALVRYFQTPHWDRDVNERAGRARGSLARAFGPLLIRLATGRDGGVERPAGVKSALAVLDSKFAGYGQHDAHECARVLLAGLSDDLNLVRNPPPYESIQDVEGESSHARSERWWSNYSARNRGVVVDTFAGQLRSTLVCQSCSRRSEAFDPFMDLSLPIPKSSSASGGVVSALSRLSFGSSSSASTGITLASCFRAFCREELLRDAEAVYCSRCRTHRSHTKQLRVWRWPAVLVLHLKRFSYGSGSSAAFGGYSYGGGARAKISVDVDFPLVLDGAALQEAEGSGGKDASAEGAPPAPRCYDLYAVVNHMGSSHGGHYTAHARVSDSHDAPFYTFNDSTVTPVSSSAIKGPAAYVLFYKMREDK